MRWMKNGAVFWGKIIFWLAFLLMERKKSIMPIVMTKRGMEHMPE